jgi:hypothetical protein
MAEKTVKRRLQDCDAALASDDGPIFSTVAKLVEVLKRSIPEGTQNTELKQEALRHGRELLRATKYEETWDGAIARDMSTPLSRRRRHWWGVIAYEVWMLRGMVAVLTIPNHPFRHDVRLNNSVNENVVLHIRNLCDFCTSPHADDIKPSDLFDNYAKDPKYKGLQRLIRRLHKKYGTNRQGCVRWAFNKKLAHLTKTRGTKFTYTRYAMRVLPVLEDVFTEIERLKGRSFESLLFAPKVARKRP